MILPAMEMTTSQLKLEQWFLILLMNLGQDGYKRLPINFRTTVFSIAAHQDIFRTIELMHQDKVQIDPSSVSKRCMNGLAAEIANMVTAVSLEEQLDEDRFEGLAAELIERAEGVPPRNSETEDRATPVRGLINPQFSPLPPAELTDILGLSIKRDELNKLITFLCQLSAYTETSQLNISFNAPSSTGKSFIPMEIARLFPEEDVREIAYCSPTAFFHDCGKYIKEKDGYIVDLERKIMIFLDQPHTMLLQHLRPLLSHDKKEIQIKITDKSQKGGLRTKNIYLRGFPAVIFCTAGLKLDEQESTRFLLLSPESSQAKIREAITEKIKRETDSDKYRKWLESDPRRILLKSRIRAIKAERITDIRLGNSEIINQEFFNRNKILKPRHQRDVGRIIGIIKAIALLNLWFRDRINGTINANAEDIAQAFEIWQSISASQDVSLPPYIYQIFTEVIIPAFTEKNSFPLGESPTSGKIGLTRRDIVLAHYDVLGRSLPDYLLRQQIIPMLEASGLIVQENDPTDKRKILIYPVNNNDSNGLQSKHPW
jgi:hypothetical protein